MFRPLRQHRYDVLRAEGFLPFESYALSKLRIGAPAMLTLRTERRAVRRQWERNIDRARAERRPEKRPLPWRAYINQMYDARGWYAKWEGRRNPFGRLREIADKYRYEHPDYETPVRKRGGRADPKKIREKLETSLTLRQLKEQAA